MLGMAVRNKGWQGSGFILICFAWLFKPIPEHGGSARKA
jgi:hypothetical protein